MKKTTYFLSLVFALFANTNNINAQTKIWGVGSGVGEADAQFSNAFVNSTTASGYSTTQWTALTVYESDGTVTPGNAYWVRNLNGISSGGYATGMTALASPSAANGAALFDSDFMDNGGVVGAFGTGVSPGIHKGELISPIIDLTGYTDEQVAVTFYSYYRRYQIDNYSISFSTDDGATWVESVDIQVLQPVAVNADVEGSVTAIFNTATQGVANLTQCRIKFTFEGYYYNAFIDDITIENILPNIPNLVISEIMYNGPEAGTDTTEFIEIYNNDANPVDLTNYSFSQGVTYTFPNVTLNPGEFYVIAVNSGAFNNVFGFMPNGVFTGALSNAGEDVTIVDANGNMVDSVDYKSSGIWPTQANGQGASLILCDVNSDNNNGNNWNACATQTGVIINGFEVLASPGVANVCCSNTASTVNAPVCSGNSYTYVDGTTVNNVTADVSYVSTIPNAGGCDSVVTENITVLSLPTGNNNTTICAEESVVINGTIYNASNPTGVEVFVAGGFNGCDSIVTVALNVLPALVGTDNTTICATGSVVINGTTYDASNSTGTEVFTNVGANGCDSTVTVALNVLAAVDVTVDNSLVPTLSANQAGATYRWLDCDNGNAPISGEINQTFTATVNGNYAVEVTFNGCVDTSACENITGVGIKEATNNVVSIYPNPTNGMVNISLGSNNTAVDYTISSIEGRIIEIGKTSTNNITVDLSKEGKGVYFIRINTENTSTVYKLIKQ